MTGPVSLRRVPCSVSQVEALLWIAPPVLHYPPSGFTPPASGQGICPLSSAALVSTRIAAVALISPPRAVIYFIICLAPFGVL